MDEFPNGRTLAYRIGEAEKDIQGLEVKMNTGFEKMHERMDRRDEKNGRTLNAVLFLLISALLSFSATAIFFALNQSAG